MKKYNELVKEGGALSDEGKKFVKNFTDSLNDLLSSKEVNSMSVSEMRTFGGILAKIVGDATSFKLENKINYRDRFNSMSHNEFRNYLKNKYGDDFMQARLTEDEFQAYCTKEIEQFKF